ncbi:MAG: PEP/pyruvate-binding domain-containing protein [Kiritimatiellae bacterium]|nr:PEP/pyruvate-binding domain-containing protein [Kiritimatiellia bacterium]
MVRSAAQFSTGIEDLDRLLRGLMSGDNVVWQVDSVADYVPFVVPYCRNALKNRQRVIYFRFAEHPPVLSEADGATIYQFDPHEGFEPFLGRIHQVVDESGRGTLYVFDCLSELAADWCSDRMLGNFFMLTCPYLYDRGAMAYFSILRHRHSFHAVKPISNTTQVLIDVYRHDGRLYIHPIKVQHRHSPTMYMLHVWEGERFTPVTQSCIIADILHRVPWSKQEAASYLLGYWTRTFVEAEAVQKNADAGLDVREQMDFYFHKILRMMISRDEAVLRLAERYLSLRDLLEVRRRMIGTGLIGGKAVGMLLARAILRAADPSWNDRLEVHDSFFVGADVFYTYLVQNGCWWMMRKYKSGNGVSDETETARRRILAGEFPEYIVSQFSDMLDYFGQSPIIVRSSSLLEDAFGSAFAGKYESVFCANQGGPHKRLEDFLSAVRMVYASMMSEDALTYRAERGLLKHDEQMALLIQRVSGATYGNFFYPQVAGVGFSFNPYVWHESINPEAGVLRVVFGVGTRAVERSDDDYTRIVALNAPMRRPESNLEEMRQYTQRRVDVLDLEANQLVSTRFEDVIERSAGIPLELFVSEDVSTVRSETTKSGRRSRGLLLTFDGLLTETSFVEDMRRMLGTLEEAYETPVDIEFTVNFLDNRRYKINLLQCRPLQVRRVGNLAIMPDGIPECDVLLRSNGPVIGKSCIRRIDWFVYVVPGVYGELPDRDRYQVARLIGEITRHPGLTQGTIMLLGPGRWGTSTPSLGIPVSYAEISRVSVLCEIVAMRKDFVPDVSLGTHFFHELVEMDAVYLALFPTQVGSLLNTDFFLGAPNRLPDLLPQRTNLSHVVRVLDARPVSPDGSGVVLAVNALEQRVICYRETQGASRH